MENIKEECGDLMDFLEASRYLKVSPSTLRQKYQEWKIPYFYVGRNVRFSKVAVWKWLHTTSNNSGEV